MKNIKVRRAEEKEQRTLFEEWQERLGLTDWQIKLVTECSPEDMALENCAGCTEWTESNKTAKIEILDPQHYGERIVPFDFEKTLVHELLHLKLSLVSDGVSELQERYMHQVIDDLARAFVSTKRGGGEEYNVRRIKDKTVKEFLGRWRAETPKSRREISKRLARLRGDLSPRYVRQLVMVVYNIAEDVVEECAKEMISE